MCASFEARFSVRDVVDAFADAGAPVTFPGGLPNLEPVDEVRPTDSSLVVRGAASAGGEAKLMRFGLPPSAPKRPPVINLRSEGRRFGGGATGRAIVPVSGFYEFTGDRYPKTRWVFRASDASLLALAAVWRDTADGPAFALLTAEPGPDIAPYHDRGVIPLAPSTWASWLSGEATEAEVLKPAPGDVLAVEAAPRPPKG